MRFFKDGTLRAIVGGVFLLGCASQAVAQKAEILSRASDDYYWSCLPCHGESGKGDGSMASILVKPPADLTQIAKSNGGKFPFWKVFEIVSGQSKVIGHETLQMPNYWSRYRSDDVKPGFLPAEIRVLLLTHYLESKQAQAH